MQGKNNQQFNNTPKRFNSPRGPHPRIHMPPRHKFQHQNMSKQESPNNHNGPVMNGGGYVLKNKRIFILVQGID